MILKYGQSLESFVEEWFKQAAYSIILLRNEGYPCVFYGDFYGIPHDNKQPVKDLETLIRLRKEKSYGEQHDYFDDKNCIGWTREGDNEHLQSGLAVVISNPSTYILPLSGLISPISCFKSTLFPVPEGPIM